jgi:hypothetical protein
MDPAPPSRGHLGPEQKLYFNHIRKTAGTTLYSLLDLHFASHEILPAYTPPQLLQVPEEKKAGYRLYRGHFGWMLPELLGISCVGMTMLRDPIRRALSEFEHGQRAPETFLHGRTLEDFYEDTSGFREFFEDNHLRNLMPVEMFGTLPREEKVALARANLEKLAYFGIVERFEESMLLLAHTFGWPPPAEIQRLNVTPATAKLERPGREVRKDILDTIGELNQGDVVLYDEASRIFDLRMVRMQRELIEEASRERYRRSPVVFPFRLLMNEAVPGTGWHGHEDLEGKHGVVFRWTGPGTESTVHLRLPTDRDLTFEMVIVHAVVEDVLDSLGLRVNGVPVPLTYVERNGTRARMRARIPARVMGLDAVTVLTIVTSRTVSPRELDSENPDYRRLGVAVEQIRIDHAETATPALS